MNRTMNVLLVGLLLPAGCGGGGSSDNPRNPAPAVNIVNAFPSLNFVAPVFLTGFPGSNQVAVVEQGGKIHRFDADEQVTSTVIILDISNQVLFAGEQGLLGLAFHPDFDNNGYFYVNYSASTPRRSILSRFTYNSMTGVASPTSESVLLEVAQPATNHNGGSLAFGPDGKLYVALGDGGGSGDPGDNAQNLANLLGTLLRIDVDAASPYGIPVDNPFFGIMGVREEIWAYGLRNPFRFSFDRLTGTLWAGDVGQNALEEIDIIQPGGNYGWRVFEGTQAFDTSQNTPPNASFIPPVYEYDRNQGTAVIGGYVYRGSTLTSLWGNYIYGDFGSGRVWSLEYDGSQVASNTLIGNVPAITSLGEDNSAEIYVVSGNGSIFRLEELN